MKTIYKLAILLLLTIFATGCSETIEAHNDASYIKNNIINIENSSIEDLYGTQEEIELSIPVFLASPQIFDNELTVDRFIKDELYDEEESFDEENKEIRKFYTSTSGKELFIKSGSFQYRTKLAKQINNILAFLEQDSYGVLLVEDEVEDLSFMDKDEAISLSYQYLNSFGIEFRFLKIISIDSNFLNQKQQHLLKTENHFSALVENNAITLRDWNEQDNCYFIYFVVSINDTDMIRSDLYIPTLDRTAEASTIQVAISERGIEYFEVIGTIYETKGIEETPSELITVDMAAHIVEEKNKSIYAESILLQVNIIGQSLVYVPIPTNKITNSPREFDLMPAWCFIIEEIYDMSKASGNFSSSDNSEVKYTHLVYVNAVTGKLIE